MTKNHIIIGGSAAGIAALNTLRRLDPQANIICITGQHEMPYNKCHLVDYCCGIKTREQLSILDVAGLSGTVQILPKWVERIEPDQQRIVLADGSTLAYDALFVGTGARAFIPPLFEGVSYTNLFTFHTLADADGILHFIKTHTPRTAVVIGAGLSGLECADALATHGVQVNIVELGSRVLYNQLPPQASEFIERRMLGQGVVLYENTSITALLSAGGAALKEVRLADGTQMPVDMVVIAAGVRPNSHLFSNLGVTMPDAHIVVDEYQQTALANVFAGGDVAMVKDQITGQYTPSCTWPDAMLQGTIAAYNMAGQPKKYPGAVPMVSSAFFGTKFVVCGNVKHPSDSYDVITNQGADFHHTFVMDGDLIKAFCLVGSTNLQATLRRALLTAQPIGKNQLTTL